MIIIYYRSDFGKVYFTKLDFTFPRRLLFSCKIIHMSDVHPIQTEILSRLMYSNGLKYTVLKKGLTMENSQFIFHIDKLIQKGLVFKYEKKYELTTLGKEFANRMDIETKAFTQFPKTTCMLCGIREIEGRKEVLLYTRKKNPFYGSQGFPTQKVLFGESIIQTASKGFTDETGLTGIPEIKAIRHYHVLHPHNDTIFEDKIMYIFVFNNPIGTLRGAPEGEYYWMDIEMIEQNISQPLPEFAESLDIILARKEYEFFREDRQITVNF